MEYDKKILLIGTGGTIACKETDAGLMPALTAEEILEYVPEVKKYAFIETLQVCNIDSTDVRPKEWMLIASAIKENYDKYDGFVVCHGTDTLAYTAAALSYMIRHSVKPIVVTGAQKPINAADTDARRNLRDSIAIAANDDSHRVVIVFDGKVIAGTRAKKERSKSFDAFSSINFPNLAVVQDGKIHRYIKDFDLSKPTKWSELMSDKVFILKMTPGMNEDVLRYLFDKYECIIVESFGLGGIPNYLKDEFKKQVSAHDTLVIVATQVVQEGSDMGIYQVGHEVKEDLGLLETYDMTLESAYAKASWIMGLKEKEGLTHDELKEKFYKPIGYDITYFE
ncbi:MAG: asparaginase [Firmicutes bacterium]|nr:asparaginase [Bacillota bacterium]